MFNLAALFKRSARNHRNRKPERQRRIESPTFQGLEPLEPRLLLSADLLGYEPSDNPDYQFKVCNSSGVEVSSFKWGDTIQIKSSTANLGDVSSGVFSNRFYLSNDSTIGDSDDYYLGNQLYSSLDGSKYRPITTTLSLPSTPPSGYSSSDSIYFGMKVDIYGQVSESDELNNYNYDDGKDKRGYYSITLPAQPPDPDLEWVSGIPSTVNVNESFTVIIQAENDANVGLAGSSITASVDHSAGANKVNISASRPSWVLSSDWLVAQPGYSPIYHRTSGAMTAQDWLIEGSEGNWTSGESHQMSFTVTPTQIGTVYVRIRTTMTDGTNWYSDHSVSGGSSGTDQQGWEVEEYAITVVQPKPNLRGTSFNADEPLIAGQGFEIDYNVENNGNANAGAFDVKFYLSRDATIDSGDYYLGEHRIGGLNASNSTGTLHKDVWLPNSHHSIWDGGDNYYIGMIVDADSEISESDENDNRNRGNGLDRDSVDITGDEETGNVELTLYHVSDTSGTPNSSSPGTTRTDFAAGETVRVTLRANNTSTSLPPAVVLNIENPSGTLVYDSHPIGQDNTADSPLNNSETDYYSFDWTIPTGAVTGWYDVLASIRNSTDWDTVVDTTASGRADVDFENAKLQDKFQVINAPSPDLLSFSGIPTSIEAGTPFTVTVTAENDANIGGPGSSISASILYANSSDTLNQLVVGDPTLVGWANDYTDTFQAGVDTIYHKEESIGEFIAQHWLVEAAETNWTSGEVHSMSFEVTPLVAGNLYLRLRTTMSDLAGHFHNDASISGYSQTTDQQGWTTVEILVSVTQTVTLLDISVNETVTRDGRTLTLGYQISSPDSCSAWLGATIKSPDETNINDVPNDNTVTLSPGTHWYYRDFDINLPPSAPTGSDNRYDLALGVHWGEDQATYVDRTDYLTMQQTVPVELPIIMYHKVDDVAYSQYYVTTDMFRAQMETLEAYGYDPITFDDLAEMRAGNKSIPDKPIIITFDDAYQNWLTDVTPVLQDLSASGWDVVVTGAVPTGRVGTTNAWDTGAIGEGEPVINHLTWAEIQTLHATGLWDFQSHSHIHPDLTTSTLSQVQSELTISEQLLETNLPGHDVQWLVYPFGAYEGDIPGTSPTMTVADVAWNLGYFGAVKAWDGIEENSLNKWELDRIAIDWDDTVDYDPANEANFFMMKIDPTFVAPDIGIDSVQYLNPDTEMVFDPSEIAPGQSVIVRITATNHEPEPASVTVSLNIDGDANHGVYDYDSYIAGDDIVRHSFTGTQTFEWTWEAPLSAQIGQHYVNIGFHDMHYVLGYEYLGWQSAFCVQPFVPADPEILQVIYPASVHVGEWAEISVQVTNHGRASTDGGVTFSFPGLDAGAADKSLVADNGSDSDDLSLDVRGAGELIYHRDTDVGQFPADYLLAEWSDPDFNTGETNWVRIKVKPMDAGVFWFNVRSALGINSQYEGYPDVGLADQQGWEVQQYLINVQDDGFTWTSIHQDGEVYQVFGVTNDGSVVPPDRPFSVPQDQGTLIAVYVEDASGQVLSVEQARNLLIRAQSGVKFDLVGALTSQPAIYSWDFTSELRQDNSGNTYSTLRPQVLADWWSDAFIYEGAFVFRPGLDSLSVRADRYNKIIINASLQPELAYPEYFPTQHIHDRLFNLASLGLAAEGADSILGGVLSGLQGQLLVDAFDASGNPQATYSAGFISDLLSDLVAVANNEQLRQAFHLPQKFYLYANQASQALGAINSTVKLTENITADWARQYIMQVLATSEAQSRLDAIKSLHDRLPAPDPAFTQGLADAQGAFEDAQAAFHEGSIDVLESILNGDNFVTALNFGTQISNVLFASSHLLKHVSSALLPWFMSWEIWKLIDAQETNAEEATIGATFTDLVGGPHGLPWLRGQAVEGGVVKEDVVDEAIHLSQVYFYGGQATYDRTLDVTNNCLTWLSGILIGGQDYEAYMNDLKQAAAEATARLARISGDYGFAYSQLPYDLNHADDEYAWLRSLVTDAESSGGDISVVADFDVVLNPSGLTPLTVSFRDTSYFASGWRWDFGDGTDMVGSYGGQTISHTYWQPGLYDVVLEATDGTNTDRSPSQRISVTAPAPVADFSISNGSGVAPLNVGFFDTSLGLISEHSWNFGDGESSTEENSFHVYADAGTYNVNLQVVGPGGSDIMVQQGVIVVSGAMGDLSLTTNRPDSPIHVTGPTERFAVGDSIVFSDLPAGDYTVHFGNLAGMETPALKEVTVYHEQVASASGIYVATTTVATRHIFYNRSAWDGNDAAANTNDDNAIASDKQALMPGDAATFANYTSYSRGINGIMIDIAGLSSTPSASDFEFKVGNSDDPSAWAAAPAPQSITVRAGAGTGGSDRVTLIWADNDLDDIVDPNEGVAKQWLQITVRSDDNGGSIGLAEDDVFYFGNAIGETGNFPTNAIVNAADEIGARNNPAFFPPAELTNVYDFDRNKLVNAADQILARNNITFFDALKLVNIPAAASSAESMMVMTLTSEQIVSTSNSVPIVEEPMVDLVVEPETPVTSTEPVSLAISTQPKTSSLAHMPLMMETELVSVLDTVTDNHELAQIRKKEFSNRLPRFNSAANWLSSSSREFQRVESWDIGRLFQDDSLFTTLNRSLHVEWFWSHYKRDLDILEGDDVGDDFLIDLLALYPIPKNS